MKKKIEENEVIFLFKHYEHGLCPEFQESWQHRSLGHRGVINPNQTTALTCGSSSVTPGAASKPAPPTLNKYSTQQNDVASYESRLHGALSGQRGSAVPWASMRTYSGPGQLPPASTQPSGGFIPNLSSTAATDLESWTARGTQMGLRGKFSPHSHHRLGEVKAGVKPAPTVTQAAPLDSSSAANDMFSWNSRIQASPYTRGQVEPFLQTLTESQTRQAPLRGASKQGPALTSWSTASVDTGSWEARVNKAFPERLAFKSARGQVLLDTYIGQGYGFVGRK